ncbi:hypothetical protein D3Z55_02610 [Clostridiaceae bacterium]|nr:hypothetical protein [Clostridiaceae bacterium]
MREHGKHEAEWYRAERVCVSGKNPETQFFCDCIGGSIKKYYAVHKNTEVHKHRAVHKNRQEEKDYGRL